MKLIEIKIENIRGIKNITLSPNGENFVVWGPNGSGKSALIDAIDFLLTGKVTRLKGESTKEITLAKHGPHIDTTPKEAKVEATFQLTKGNKQVKISRRFDNPSKLIICNETENIRQEIEEIETLAKRGQHILTRREILKYINSEGATRAQEIQSLLNISEIEDIRKTFVKIKGNCDKEVKNAKKNIEDLQSQINSTTQLTSFSIEKLLEVVNLNRQIIGGESITNISSKSIKEELNPFIKSTNGQTYNLSLFEKNIKSLKMYLYEENQIRLERNELNLVKKLKNILSDKLLLKSLRQKELIDLGIKSLEDNNICPLCDTDWQEKELKQYLINKKEKARIANEIQNSINPIVNQIKEHFNNIKASLEHILLFIKEYQELFKEQEIILTWKTEILNYLSLFDDIYSLYNTSKYNQKKMLKSFSAEDLGFIDNINAIVKANSPTTSPEQIAWDVLTKLEAYLNMYEDFCNVLHEKEEIANKAEALLLSFQSARDDVLSELYNSISSKFIELYRALHGEDEKDFKAYIKPEGPSLRFEVDFYGRGNHPPNALHSEGHQDSMGLCLYLVLNERLTYGLIDVILLDDVVMSVDSAHRKTLCNLLARYFHNKQFIITTHDKTWSNQLKYEGVVSSKNRIEFYNWHIDTGPYINFETDLWERIYIDIKRNDIPNAAAKLRRGSEEYFSQVCESLKAEVPYKQSGNYELGELLSASIKKLNNLLGKAKCSAQSWGYIELHKTLNEITSTNSQIFKRIGCEQWTVNVNVHYNDWTNFIAQDFQLVVESFQDLFNVFKCSNCGGLIKLISKSNIIESLKCNCGKINWNLVEKN